MYTYMYIYIYICIYYKYGVCVVCAVRFFVDTSDIFFC